MKKKHFVAMAKALRETAPRVTWENKRQQWRTDILTIAKEYKKLNELFNFERFFLACGVTDRENTEMLYTL